MPREAQSAARAPGGFLTARAHAKQQEELGEPLLIEVAVVRRQLAFERGADCADQRHDRREREGEQHRLVEWPVVAPVKVRQCDGEHYYHDEVEPHLGGLADERCNQPDEAEQGQQDRPHQQHKLVELELKLREHEQGRADKREGGDHVLYELPMTLRHPRPRRVRGALALRLTPAPPGLRVASLRTSALWATFGHDRFFWRAPGAVMIP